MRSFTPLLALTLLLIPAAHGFEIGQSQGSTEDYAAFGASGSGKASATLRAVEQYDYPLGGFSVGVDWAGKDRSWEVLYSVQCIDDGAGALPSVFDFGDDGGGGTFYEIKQTASYFTEPEAFMHNLYRTICKDIPGNLFP